MTDLKSKSEFTIFVPDGQIFSSPEEIMKFNSCRLIFERRLYQEDDQNKIAAFQPIIRWMRTVVENIAPELLSDE